MNRTVFDYCSSSLISAKDKKEESNRHDKGGGFVASCAFVDPRMKMGAGVKDPRLLLVLDLYRTGLGWSDTQSSLRRRILSLG